MEIYKRKVGYEDLGKTPNLIVTATTLYFPFMLTQNFEDIGLYTDTENPTYELISFPSSWDLTNNGVGQKTCLTLNKCVVSFTPTPITYFNANNGGLTATITNSGSIDCPSPQTIKWTGPNNFTSTNLTAGVGNLAAGNYTIKITDANCDVTYASYLLTQPQALSFNLTSSNSQTNVTTPGGCNGSASVSIFGGQPPYTYSWFSGTTIYGTTSGITNLCAGNYTVQIVDSTNTIISGNFNITEPSIVTGSVISVINLTCNSVNEGEIKVQAGGGISVPNGYSFTLTGPTNKIITGSTGIVTFTDLPSGNYTIVISDSIGNTTTVSTTVTQPVILTNSITPTNVNCYDTETGSIAINVTGGQPPYNITINQNGILYLTPTTNNSYTLSNLVAATYDITTEDTNLCQTNTSTVVIKQQPKLNITRTSPTTNYNGYNLACFGDTENITFQTSYSTDSTTLSPVATNPIAYYLNGVHILPNVTGLVTTKTIAISAGTHTVTAVNTITNCSASTVITMTQPPSPLSITYGVIAVNDQATGCAGCGVSPDDCRQGVVDINGGVAPYTITWAGGINQTGVPGSFITSKPDCNGQTINVTVTDNNGCTVGPINITLTV